jgi:hypothetical protein
MASLTSTRAILLYEVVRRGDVADGDSPARAPYDAAVLIFLLLGFTPWLLLLTLAIALYLTVIELRELELHYTWWIWWLLLVFMTHFVGYLLLRGYAFFRRRQLAQP